MKLLTFKVSGHSENNTKTIVNARNFKLVIDEPESLGGNNEGATPVEFLLAALVGCLTVVGNLVAKEMHKALQCQQQEVTYLAIARTGGIYRLTSQRVLHKVQILSRRMSTTPLTTH